MYKRSFGVLMMAGMLMGLAFQGGSVANASENNGVLIENALFEMSFCKDGGLESVRSKLTDQTCFQNHRSTPPFRVFLDVAEESTSFSGSQTDAETLDSWQPVPLRLIKYDKQNNGGNNAEGATLHEFMFGNDQEMVVAKLVITVPQTGVSSEWSLKVINVGNASRRIGALFPYFDQVGIGANGSGNDQACGGGAYPYSSKGYGGINISMQWMSRFDSDFDTGFGLLVEDKSCSDKMLYNWPEQGKLYVGYPSEIVPAGDTRTFPLTKVMVHKGDWHKVADAYRKWFQKSFDLTYSKSYEQALKEGITGAENKYTPEWLNNRTSWYGLLRYYSGLRPFHLSEARQVGGAPLIEIEPCSVIDHRTWVYDIDKYRKVVDEIHRDGGRVIAYVQGYCYGCWGGRDEDYPVNILAKKWSVMNEKGELPSAYAHLGGWLGMCPAVEDWQDFLAETCAKIVRELDVDGIRLDSLGAEIPWLCSNPAHSHYPKTSVWNPGILEILRKVKTAIRKEKPDAVLLAEDAMDFHYQYVDAALKLRFYNYNNGVNIERYTLPGMRIFGIKIPSDYDSWAKAGKWSETSWADGVNMTGVNGISPSQYNSKYFCSPLFLNWMKAGKMFSEALFLGDAVDIVQSPDSRVLSRLFKAHDYYLLAVTKLTGSTTPPHPLSFSLKDINEKIDLNRAVKISMRDFSFDPISVRREEDRYNLSVECCAGEAYLIFLPMDNARPIALISPVETLTPGQATRLKIELLDKSSQRKPVKVTLRAPGLIMPENASSLSVNLPAVIDISVPQDSPTMTYQVSVDGPQILGAYLNIDVINLSEVQTVDKKVHFHDDFANVGIDPEKWDIATAVDVPKTNGQSSGAMVEAGALRLLGENKKSSSVTGRFELPLDSFLTFDFYQPSDEVSGYMSTISYKEPGSRHPAWYMEFARDRWFFYTSDSTKGGWRLRGSEIMAKNGKWYTISVRTLEKSCSITIIDRQTGMPVGQRQLVYDPIKGGGKVEFSATSNDVGKRGMKLDNVTLKTYIASQREYQNGENVYLKIVKKGTTPPNKWAPIYSAYADFSALDNLFQADSVFVEEDYFRDNCHIIISGYKISDNNSRENGLKAVPVTIVDVNNFHPMTVLGMNIELNNPGSVKGKQ